MIVGSEREYDELMSKSDEDVVDESFSSDVLEENKQDQK